MIFFWLGFLAFVAFFLALDLGVFHRKAHVVRIREALTWSGVWVTTSLLFSVFVYFAYANQWQGLGIPQEGGEGVSGALAWKSYVTGYVLEWSLSVDNIFVIALIFAYFRIPAIYQHRVLFWGILGAVIMRGVFIALGTTLIEQFHWVIYLFGAFLVFTAWKMLSADEEPDPGKSRIVRFVYKHFRVSNEFEGQRFFIRRQGDDGVSRRFLTPLMLALIVVEATDVVFAVDSIPAIFGITREPFIVFTSNIFAVMGLRSMYFALAGLIDKFHHLKTSLALILGFIGLKMLFGSWFEHQVGLDHDTFSTITLGVVLALLVAGVIASLLLPAKKSHDTELAAGAVNPDDPNQPRVPREESHAE